MANIRTSPATVLATKILGQAVDVGFGVDMDDFDGYLERMTRTLSEKVGFVADHADADVIVDFGCADGAMLRYLKSTQNDSRNRQYIGYDISKPMIEKARSSKGAEGILFTANWDDVTNAVKEAHANGKTATLVFSSVLHEVLHYLAPKEKTVFFDRLWNSGFDTIAIRDMMPSKAINRQSNPADVAKIKAHYDAEKITQWEDYWGPLTNQKSLVHFILTAPYTENWMRELQENYFPCTMEEFVASIPKTYQLEHREHFTHPMSRQYANDTFGITLLDETHVKLVLRKAQKVQEKAHASPLLLTP